MKTKLHYYCFNTQDQEQAEQWQALEHKLADTHKRHQSHSGSPQSITNKNETETIQLDPSFLFNDQWNEEQRSPSISGRRLFDWYLEYRLEGKNIKQGHWLELTPEMIEIRDTTVVCGYCGKYAPVGEHVFCPHCLGNEYLEEKQLLLLRMLPVSRDKFTVELPELSTKERAELLPKYKTAQGLGKQKRDEMEQSKNRQSVAALIPEAEAKAKEAVQGAYIKTEAYTWLLDHELNILDNVIYYDHKKVFCFGWRNSLSGEEKEKLSHSLAGFPFVYELN